MKKNKTSFGFKEVDSEQKADLVGEVFDTVSEVAVEEVQQASGPHKQRIPRSRPEPIRVSESLFCFWFCFLFCFVCLFV